MKHIVMITAMAFGAVLFTVGLSLGAAHEMDSMGEGKMMEESKGTMMEEYAQPKTATHDLDTSQVRRVQEILKDKGYSPGPVDGIIGPKTKQALRSFQESEGLTVTGKADKETLQALAPDAETQEFFGLSPEFGEKEMKEEGEKEMPSETESRGYRY